jgi:hypothetical protein
VKRTLTHRRMIFHTFRARAIAPPQAHASYRWLASSELKTIGLSRASEAILENLSVA